MNPASTFAPRWRGPFASALVLASAWACALEAGCGYTEIRDQCPSCTVVSRTLEPPSLPAGARTVFLIVPGLLGFGWEWDEPLRHLRKVPDSAILAFDWRPSSTVTRVSRDLADTLDLLLRQEGALERVMVIGHSAGGLITALAGAGVVVPARRAVHIVNIGTPYAGMHTMPSEYPRDAWRSPVALAVGGTFSRYPALAAGVTLESWITPYPGDPVMMPRFGHRPDDPSVGPAGPRLRAPAGTDHNRFVARVVEVIVDRVCRESSTPVAGVQHRRQEQTGY